MTSQRKSFGFRSSMRRSQPTTPMEGREERGRGEREKGRKRGGGELDEECGEGLKRRRVEEGGGEGGFNEVEEAGEVVRTQPI